MSFRVKIESNIKSLLNEEEKVKQRILYAWGLKWQELATKIITRNKIIDTGRLRGSLTFCAPTKTGAPINRVKENTSDDFITSTVENTVTVGTNVEYARKQEFENPKGAFVRPAIMEFTDSYQLIAEEELRNAK